MPLQRTVRRTDGLLIYSGNQQKTTLPGSGSVQMLGEEIERKEKIMMKFEFWDGKVVLRIKAKDAVDAAADAGLMISILYSKIYENAGPEDAKAFKTGMKLLMDDKGPIWTSKQFDGVQINNVSEVEMALKSMASKNTTEPAAEDVDLEQMTRDAARTAMEKRMGEKNDASGT